MATSSRLRGNVNPILTLKLGAGTATSYADDIKKLDFTPAKKDDSDITFAEAESTGGFDWSLNGTAIVSFDAGSLCAFLMDNAGATVTVKVGLWGNATATATKPHWTGDAKISIPPALSNEARTSLEGAEFEFTLDFVTAPAKQIV